MPAATKLKSKSRPQRAELPVPEELAAELERAPKAKSHFATLASSCRREYLEWITAAKKAETRTRRLRKTIARLSAGRRQP